MYKRFRDRAQFLFIYIREAHPTDGWQVPDNQRDGVLYQDPKSAGERQVLACTATDRLKLDMLTLTDTMDNKTEKDYSAWPERLHVVDRQGKIAYKGAPGPGGFKPNELARFLSSFVQRPDQQVVK